LPNLWENDIPVHITPIDTSTPSATWTDDHELPFSPRDEVEINTRDDMDEEDEPITAEKEPEEEIYAPKDFERGTWFDPSNTAYGCGKRLKTLYSQVLEFTNGANNLENIEKIFVTLADDEPPSYTEAMKSSNADQWIQACQDKYNNLVGYGTW
jgi:hypothetical protein